MTDEQIIEAMARAMFKDDQMCRLEIAKAALAVCRPIIEAQERERCARIAEDMADTGVFQPKNGFVGGYQCAGKEIAAAIRETGE